MRKQRLLWLVAPLMACGTFLAEPDAVAPSGDGGADGSSDDGAIAPDAPAPSDAASDAASDAKKDGGAPRAIPCGDAGCFSDETCCFSTTSATCVTSTTTCSGARLACLGQRDCVTGQRCCIVDTAGVITSACKKSCASGERQLCWKDEPDSPKVGCDAGTICTGVHMDDFYGLPNAPYGLCE